MKQKLIRGLFLLLILCGLPACGRQETDTREFTEDLNFRPLTEDTEEAARRVTSRAEVVDEVQKLYELTDLLPSPENMHFSDCAVRPDGNLLLLYEDDLRDYGNDPEELPKYSIYFLNVSDGSVSSVAQDMELKLYDYNTWFHECRFISLDPLVVYDEMGRTCYFAGADKGYTLEMTPDIYSVSFFSSRGYEYLLDSNGGIRRLVEGQNGFSQYEVWDLPEGCDIPALFSVDDNQVVLTALTKWDDREDEIFFRVDLGTGVTEEVYTRAPAYGELVLSCGEGGNLNCCMDKAELQGLMVREGEEIRSLRYYRSEPEFDALRNAVTEILGKDQAIREGRCAFGIRDPEGQGIRFYLWDYGELPAGTYREPEHTLYELREISRDSNQLLKKEIEEEFGVQIYIGSEARLDYGSYQAKPEEDEDIITGTLLRLQKIYRLFPEGFLKQITAGGKPIQIHIVDSIYGDGSDNTISEAGGLQNTSSDEVYLAFAAGALATDKNVIIHETFHAVYFWLLNRGSLEEYDEEWMALNPPGFTYGYTYNETELPEDDWTWEGMNNGNMESVYFFRAYDKTYETEDVADLMAELLAEEDPPEFYHSSHIQAKCRYIFRHIREGFDTTGWPEKTSWEIALEKAE